MSMADVATWVGAVAVAVLISIMYQRLRPDATMSREDHLEMQIKELREQVKSLQTTIGLLSRRIQELETENQNLRRLVARAIRPGLDRRTNVSDVRRALDRLSAEEIRSLAYEQFPEVYQGIGADQSLQTIRLTLVEWAENHGELERLRAEIAKINEAAFGE